MITPAAGAAIYLYAHPTDMRKSFDGLSGIVRGGLGREPNEGSYFLFLNRRRDRIKVLYWDGDGLVLWYKRLERGTFESLRAEEGQDAVRIDATDLALILSGVSLASAKRRKRYSPAA